MRPLALALCLTLALPALAETRDERLSVATEYVEATIADLDMPALIATMWKPIADQSAAQGTPLSEDQQTRLEALYLENFTEPMFEIMRAQADVMADIYTLAEIQALADFYQTDLGRAAMIKLPKLVEAQQPLIMGLVQSKIGPMLPQIQGIIAEN